MLYFNRCLFRTVGDFSNIVEEMITSLVQTEMDTNTDRSLEEISVKATAIETEESPCDSDVNNNIQLQVLIRQYWLDFKWPQMYIPYCIPSKYFPKNSKD